MGQIKKNRIKTSEINDKMREEGSTTTISELSPSRHALDTGAKIKVEEQKEKEQAPQMDFNYARPGDPGIKKNNLYANRLNKFMANNPKSRPASRSNVRLAHS